MAAPSVVLGSMPCTASSTIRRRARLADDLRAFFAQAALVAAVTPIQLLLFLAPGQFHLGRIDNDNVIAGVDKRGIGGLVLSLKQSGRQGRDTAEHLPVGIDDVPTAFNGLRSGYIRPHETMDPLRKTGTTVNPNLTWSCQECQVTEPYSIALVSDFPIKLESANADTYSGGIDADHSFVIRRQKRDRICRGSPIFVGDVAGAGGTGLARRSARTVKSFSLFTKSRSVVGLDIGSSAVKAVELKAAGKGYRVAAYGTEAVPPDSIVDGAIIDGTAVAEAIRRVFESKAFKTKDVAASLSGNAVIVKKISLPVMTASELDESIYWEAEQYIPFDIQDVNLDYQILDAGGADAKGTMEVLLVAAKKEKIADYTGVIAQAGRTPVVVDVDAFALQNAYELNYGFEPGAVVVLLNAGASAININIIANAQSVFTRDISLGGNAYTEAVQRELNLPFESAELLKKGTPVDGATFEDVMPVLRAMTENVLLEVQKTFDFFKATASTDHIDRIMLSGGASRVEGFAEALQERFGTPVEMFDPFRKVTLDGKKYSADQRATIAPTAAVAVGLALRRAGDR